MRRSVSFKYTARHGERRLTSHHVRVPVARLRRLGQPLDNLIFELEQLLLVIRAQSIVDTRTRRKVERLWLPSGRRFGRELAVGCIEPCAV